MQAWIAIVLVFSALCMRAHSQPQTPQGEDAAGHREHDWHGNDKDGWPQAPEGQDAAGLGEPDWDGDNKDGQRQVPQGQDAAGLGERDWYGHNEDERWSHDGRGEDKDSSGWSIDGHSNDDAYWSRDAHHEDKDHSARWGRDHRGADEDEHWNRDGYGDDRDHSARWSRDDYGEDKDSRAHRTRDSRGDKSDDEDSYTSARLRGTRGGRGRADEESEKSEESEEKKSKKVAWVWVAFALIAGLALGSACTAMCMLFQRVKVLESKLEARAFKAGPAAWPTNLESASEATSSTCEAGMPTVVRCSDIKEGKVVAM